MATDQVVLAALALLDSHRDAFETVQPFADRTGHPVPMDTRGWSQVLVSTLTGVSGLKRKKGPDLEDGSDVKGANTWGAIDTPRFNGVLKAGTKAKTSDSIESLDAMPHLYFVLWDVSPRSRKRCRIWVVRAQKDAKFREVCGSWYAKRKCGDIGSTNFQLHPPRGKDSNVFKNTCGALVYPLLFSAEVSEQGKYQVTHYHPTILKSGKCVSA